jgi:hypothetical protein
MQNENLKTHDSRDEVEVNEGKPPFFKNWRGMYGLVLINLAVMVIIFYLITLYFR